MSPGYGGRLDPLEDRDTSYNDIDEMEDDDLDTDGEIAARRAEVEQTRCNVSSTLDAIKEKLDPETLKTQATEMAGELAEKAKQTAHEVTENVVHKVQEATTEAAHKVHDATIGRAQEAVSGAVTSVRHASSDGADFVKANPIPLALIGIGLGWLYMNMRRDDRSYRHYDSREYYRTQGYPGSIESPYTGSQVGYTGNTADYAGGYTSGYAGSYPGGMSGGGYSGDNQGAPMGEAMTHAKERVGEAVSGAKEKVGEIVDRVQGRAGEVVDRVQDRAGQVVDKVQHTATRAAHMAGEQKDRAADSFQRTLTENPLAVGIGALVIGAAVGMILPETRAENRWMGETRDQMVETAKQKAQEVGQKVQSVATETVQAAKETVKETVKEEVRNQGLAA